jgi:hypothetical protein
MTTIDDRVSAGAKWLDSNRPGWWQRIDLETLDLGDSCRCVLGQLYGDFADGPDDDRMHGGGPYGSTLGFNAGRDTWRARESEFAGRGG